LGALSVKGWGIREPLRSFIIPEPVRVVVAAPATGTLFRYALNITVETLAFMDWAPKALSNTGALMNKTY
jgi:hypothetical protein